MSSPGPRSLPTPRETPRVLGHTAAERQILAALDSGRLPHAWLIAGPDGIGKATLAYCFARRVLACPPDGPSAMAETASPTMGLPGRSIVTSESDGRLTDSLAIAETHPVFRRIKVGGHADLLVLERSYDDKRGRLRAEIPVDDVRAIGHFLRHSAAEGGWRVVLVDGVERLNSNGHNAILKLLEEPPPRALLLLVTGRPGAVLPTIRSRCRLLALSPLDDALVGRLIGDVRPDLAADERSAAVALADGSLGRALALADAGGLAVYHEIIGLLSELPTLNWTAVGAFGTRLTQRNADLLLETTQDLLVRWLGRLVRYMATHRPMPEAVPGEAALMARLGDRWSDPSHGLAAWLEVWEKVGRSFVRADGLNLDRRQVVLNAFQCIEAAVA